MQSLYRVLLCVSLLPFAGLAQADNQPSTQPVAASEAHDTATVIQPPAIELDMPLIKSEVGGMDAMLEQRLAKKAAVETTEIRLREAPQLEKKNDSTAESSE
ncbi:MAG TPA: hypothetical protein VNL72_02410 [Gammaproteobacteria bacterium]|nr:hypothetical protein [Gammaproteobacteria bacterium]